MEGVAFMKMPAASARSVARAGHRDMQAGRRVVVPGFQNKLTAWLAPRLPRRPVLALAAALFAPRGSGRG